MRYALSNSSRVSCGSLGKRLTKQRRASYAVESLELRCLLSGVAPVAGNDAFSTPLNTTLNVFAPGVLANDTDANGDTLTAILASVPAHGVLGLSANGSFTYTPVTNFSGTDSFSYRANDGTSNSNVAVVSIAVGTASSAPTAASDNYTVPANTALVIPSPGVLLNDSDPNNHSITAVLVSGAAHGSVSLNANGAFTYTPNANFNGSDAFSYMANNGTVNSNAATVSISVGSGSNVPVAADDNYTVTVNKPLVIPAPGVLLNDSDPNFHTLTAHLVSGASHGTVSLNTNGAFTYTPNSNYNGTDSFSYRANNGTLNSNTAVVSLTVGSGSSVPVAANDNYTALANTPLVIPTPGVLLNDSDPNSHSLTAVLVSGAGHGTVSLNANGSFTYTPTTNFTGGDSFTYKVNNGTLNSNTAVVSIAVSSANHPPAAANDSFTTAPSTALVISAPGVLTNDTDPDSDTLTAILASGASHGILSLNADGSFTYSPVIGFSGTDSFTYKANDGKLNSNTATVSITVAAGTGNHAPVAANDSYSTSINTALVVTAPGVLANDTDVDGNTLTALLLSSPAHGTLGLSANGAFTYTPTAGFTGNDSFTYIANDGKLNSNTATVSLTVTPAGTNHAPVAASDSYSTSMNVALVVTAPGVLANDTDADNNPLTAILVSGPTHGTLSLSASGAFTYTPTTGFTGSDGFTYKANDGTLNSNTATVSLTVTTVSVNHAPVAADDIYSTSMNTALVIAAPGVLTNDTDVDGDALTAILVAGPAHGTLGLSANGAFTYTPTTGFTGADSFTYTASDGKLNSNTATVSLTVNAVSVNHAPVAANDSYSTAMDTALVIAAPGVLANDTDVDGNALTAVLVSGPLHGTMGLGADGAFTYTPTASFTGADSFTYQANDGTLNSNTATVNLTVSETSTNHAPVAANDSYSTAVNTTLTVAAPGVLANDTDPDGNPLTAILVSNPSHGTLGLSANGAFTYTPTTGFTGTDSFTYQASDGSLNSNTATVSLTVSAGTGNHAPIAANNSYSTPMNTALVLAAPGVLGNDFDTDGDPLTASLLAGPAHGTLSLSANGSFTYTPDTGFSGSDSFTYRASDGTLFSNAATVSITTNPGAGNVAPIAGDSSYTATQNTQLVVPAPGVLANVTDADGDLLTATLTSAPLHGAIALNTDGSFAYTPDTDFSGDDTFAFTASDGTHVSNVASVTISVIAAANDIPPVSRNDAYSTTQNTPLIVTLPGVLANDTDVDGDPLTAVLVSGPAHGTLGLNADGSFTYTPAAGFTGTDSFLYQANDGTRNGNTATVNITVANRKAVTVAEKAGSVAVSVRLAAPSANPVVVPFSLSGTAQRNTDYTVSGNSITIPAGSTSGTILVRLTNDKLSEADETIVVTLAKPTNANLAGTTIETITIVDDDAPRLKPIAAVSIRSRHTIQLDATTSNAPKGTSWLKYSLVGKVPAGAHMTVPAGSPGLRLPPRQATSTP